jgi:hypothetical protein
VLEEPQRGPRGLGLARVRGVSMQPTLREGDRLLVRWGGVPSIGRLALVRLPGGRPLSVKRLAHRVPEGWWVERDNPRAGVDSWTVGAVPEDDVVAVVLARLPRLPRVRWPGSRGRCGTQ